MHPIAGEDKGLHTFPKSISPEGNVFVGLKFELTYNYAVVQHISHYTTKILPWSKGFDGKFLRKLFNTTNISDWNVDTRLFTLDCQRTEVKDFKLEGYMSRLRGQRVFDH